MKNTLTIALFFLTTISMAQNVEYVGEKTIVSVTSNEPSYYYTRSVTINPGLSGPITISATNGDFFITPIATNPPPSPLQNYVRTEVPRIPVTSEKDLTNLGGKDKAVAYTYSDGLGRVKMTSTAEAGPLYEDVIQPFRYNPATGRQDSTFLPFSNAYTKPGSFIPNSQLETETFYGTPPNGVVADSKPFGLQTFDDSPLNTPQASMGVGNDWHGQGKDAKADYFIYEDPTNTSERVVKWKIGTNGTPENVGHHASFTLQISESINEDNLKSQAVVDSRGRNIATRSWYNGGWITTYYIYDAFNRLRFILPPAIADNSTITADQLAAFAFQYEYDYRGRMNIEKAPGAGATHYVYDTRNRLVFSQDEVQRINNQWVFRKYDQFNRLIMTGIDISTNTQAQWETVLWAATGTELYEGTTNSWVGYTTGNSFPKTYDELLTVTYYDSYTFKDHASWDTDIQSDPFGYDATVQDLSLPSVHNSAVKGLTTGSMVKVLGSSPDHWLNTVIYYDDEYRAIQVVSENHLGNYDRLSNQLNDFTGVLEKMKLEHDNGGSKELNLLSEYEYDHEFRLLKTFQKINSDPQVLVASYNYNALGQLIEKNIHSTDGGNSFLQSVDYRYNIRGWLSSINNTDLNETENRASSDLFGASYHYTQSLAAGGANDVRYDGSLAGISWASDNKVDPVVKSTYGYDYDELSRLDEAKFTKGTSASWTGEFNVNPAYDDNGNIKTLTREAATTSGSETIDNLSFDYDLSHNPGDVGYEIESNKLLTVRDTGTPDGFNNLSRITGTPIDMISDYEYDENGNIKHDQHKEMAIVYNFLQLPESMTFGDGSSLTFTYDATGNRLSRTITYADGKTARMDYVGLIEYQDNEIYQLFTDEGRAFKQNDEFFYEYFITDHQGNNRVAFGILPERNVYVANMEGVASDQQFSFPTTPDVRETGQNKTSGGTKSARLNGSSSSQAVGPAKVLSIAAGDEVEIEVWAKYGSTITWNNTSIANISSLISTAFGGASAGTGAESASGSLSNTLASPPAVLFTGSNNTNGQPEAYLQYMFFDASYNYVSGGFVPVEAASDGAFGRLSSGKLTYGSAGYLFIYVANESNQNADVYFDDLNIVHESGTSSFKVSQVNEYYPFGMLTNNSWRNGGYQDPGMQYQSYYNTYDSLSETHDFFLRNYDPSLGRWMQTDPYSQFASPYVGMGNVPHIGFDPNGGFAPFLGSLLVDLGTTAAIGAVGGALYGHFSGNDPGAYALYGAGLSLGAYGAANLPFGSIGGGLSSTGEGIWRAASSAVRKVGSVLSATSADEALIGSILENTTPAEEVENRTLYANSNATVFSEDSHIKVPIQGNRPDPNAGVGLSSGGEEFIPFWGAGRDAFYWFQQGDISRGVLNSAQAISDVFVIKALGTTAVKLGGGYILKVPSKSGFKSLGAAASGFSKNFKIVKANYLRKNGIDDIHAFKSEYLGANANLSLFDVARQTDSGELLIIRKVGQEIVEFTGVIIK